MESMSNVPYYLDKARDGYGLGHGAVTDGIIKDGLWDVYYNQHMGNCAEETAAKFGITREMQDEHAVESYRRAAAAIKVWEIISGVAMCGACVYLPPRADMLALCTAWQNGWFKAEIVPVKVPGARGKPEIEISEDDEYKNLKLDKVPSLRPAFQKNGGATWF